MSRFPLAAWVVLAGSACVVNPADYAGRSCDVDADCVEGRVCRTGTCVEPQGSSSGCVKWGQSADGFTTTSICSGCTLDVNAASGNTLSARTIGNNEDESFAFGIHSVAGTTLGAEGKLRGRLLVGDNDRVGDASTFLKVSASGGASFLELAFNGSFGLRCFSASGMLAPTSVGTEFTTAHFPARQVHSIEVAWTLGGTRVVTVNGTEVLNANPDGNVGAATVQDIRLGILNNPGGDSNGWGLSLFDWEICDDREAAW